MTKARSRFLGFRQGSLLILVLLAFALRVYNLGGLDFWFDEAVSFNVSGLGWRGAIEHLRSEPFEHPPVYYLSLYPWQRLAGASEFALRFYSVFWGVLFVPLLYAFVRRLVGPHGERLALLAALLATFSPFMVAYSQEARMYTLVPCLALLLLLSFLNALERKGQPGWWLVYGLLAAVGVVTHYYFVLVWVALTLYLGLEWLRSHEAPLWSLAIQASVLAAGVIWVVAAPGLRNSLVQVAQGEMAFNLAYKLNQVMPSLMLSDIRGQEVPVEAYVLAAGGWMLLLLGVWGSRRGQMLSSSAWRLLMLLLVAPLAGSFLIPYGVLGRHLGYTLVAGFTFMALGLLALKHRARLWFAVGVLAVFLISAYGLVAQYTISQGDFGQTMAYIDEQGRPGDVLVLTQPVHRHLMGYYNRQGWPVRYLPEQNASLTPAEVNDVLGDLGQTYARIWLGPVGAWTADPEHWVERWLTTRAFQAEKTWFPDSSSAALYFPADQELAPIEIGVLIWGERILLQAAYSSPLQVPAGDALRLRLNWRSGFDLDERYAVTLSLLDDDGRVWAERRSEPCSGWCPTDAWTAGRLSQDQHALLIPPGTPPGTYNLVVAWVPPGGGSPLPAEEDGQRVDQITLAQVTVLHAEDRAGGPGSLPNPLQATFGGEITLLGYEPATFEALPGERLHLETRWRAETAPSADYDLLVELTDSRGRQVADWQVSPAASFYPTGDWLPGEVLRGQHDLTLPGALSPGRYQLRLALVGPTGERLSLSGERPRQALGGVVTWQERLEGQDVVLASGNVVDRPRQFVLPDVAYPLEATVGRKAHLVGYDLDLSQARPGGQVLLTLFWQADGPMAQPFKVFTHLVDADGLPLAQHDGPPGGGCCPTNTWAKGEVIVDEHPISLGADLPPGTYQLLTGMYDEGTDTRLPSYAADGGQLAHRLVPVGAVTVEPAVTAGQQALAPNPDGPPVRVEPLFDLEYALFFPVVCKGPWR